MLLKSEAYSVILGSLKSALIGADELRFVIFPSGKPTLDPCPIVSTQPVPREPISVPQGCNGYQIWDSSGCLYAEALHPPSSINIEQLKFHDDPEPRTQEQITKEPMSDPVIARRNELLNRLTRDAAPVNFTISQSPGREPWTLADALELLDGIDPMNQPGKNNLGRAKEILREHIEKYPNGRCPSCGKPRNEGACVGSCDDDE